jgi:hypothetical protein
MSPQNARVLAVLEEHPEGLTTWDLTMKSRCLNLTARVSELREELAPSRTITCERIGPRYLYRLAAVTPSQLSWLATA